MVRTSLNYFLIVPGLLIVLAIGLFAILIIVTGINFTTWHTDNIAYSFLSFFLLGISGIFYNSLSNNAISFQVSENGILVNQPLVFLRANYNWEEIKGYSTSEVYFGTYFWKSNSVIIYTNTGLKHELIKAYNFNFKPIQAKLIDIKVNYLGHEPFAFRGFKRAYTYDDKQSPT
ncbi:MAG: thiamine transporter ThiT [Psychroserpens sp.]|jgi:thiamine transporter ThiT